jgi:hypothetical protein
LLQVLLLVVLLLLELLLVRERRVWVLRWVSQPLGQASLLLALSRQALWREWAFWRVVWSTL